jgi:hypothetical protein
MKKTDWDMVLLVLIGGVLWFALITGVLLGYEI